MCHFFVLTTFKRHLWSVTIQTHDNLESIFLLYRGSITLYMTYWAEKKKITRLSVITGEIKLIPKISLEVCSKNYELTRVCFILSPKLIKPSLENSQAIAGFPWWNPRNHGASKIQQNINFTVLMKRQTFFFKNNAKSWTKPSMKNCLAKLLLEEANFTPRSDCGNVAFQEKITKVASY